MPRVLQTSDISALDDYIHRCGKLSSRGASSPTSLQNFAIVVFRAAIAAVRVLDTHRQAWPISSWPRSGVDAASCFIANGGTT